MDTISPIIGWAVVWLFVSFALAPLFWGCCPYTSHIYKSLRWEKKYDWNIRTSSIISAIAATFFAIQNIRFHLDESDVHQHSLDGSFPLQFMMGFFILDFAVIIINREHYGLKSVLEYVGHHIISLTGFFLAVHHQDLLWYANYRLLSEFSTPLINGRFFLQELGMRESKLYGINRTCTMLAFCTCRILTIPKFWLATYVNFLSIKNCPNSVIAVLFISGIFLDALNITWFFSIVKIVSNELRKTAEIAKEKSNIIRQRLIVKKDHMMKSLKDAQGQMKDQMYVKMDHLKDGMMNRMDNVRRRLNNSIRRQ